MRYRIELIVLAAFVSWPVFAQPSGTASKDNLVVTKTPKPAKGSHGAHLKALEGTPSKTADRTPDITKNGTVGAAGGIVKPPTKTDPELHNLNSVLPP